MNPRSIYPLIHQILISEELGFEQQSRESLKIENQFGKSQYRFWTTTKIRDFLFEEYPSTVLNAYDLLKPFAYKSDLARYCILNKMGGTYADLSITKIKSFDHYEQNMVIFRDGNSARTSWKIQNGFFYSEPNNPILEECITQIIGNVENRFLGFDPHFPTGPSVLGRAVALHGLDIKLMVGQYHWLRYRSNKYTLPNGDVVARGKRGGAYRGGDSRVFGGNNYNEMWRSGDVYG
jgi:mannosyltransferase OCH1-like enzyme